MDGSFSFFIPLSDWAQAQNAWRVLFLRHEALLASEHTSLFAEGLKQTGFNSQRLPAFMDIEGFLRPYGWSAVKVHEPLTFLDTLKYFAHQQFPVPMFIRDRQHLDYSKTPDFFVLCFAQLPLLFFSDYRSVLAEFGRLSQLLVSDKADFLDGLERQYWYSLAKGLLNSEMGLQVIGFLLLESPSERQYSLDDSRQKVYGLHPVMRTPVVGDKFSNIYYVFDNYSQLRRSLLDFERMYKNA